MTSSATCSVHLYEMLGLSGKAILFVGNRTMAYMKLLHNCSNVNVRNGLIVYSTWGTANLSTASTPLPHRPPAVI